VTCEFLPSNWAPGRAFAGLDAQAATPPEHLSDRQPQTTAIRLLDKGIMARAETE